MCSSNVAKRLKNLSSHKRNHDAPAALGPSLQRKNIVLKSFHPIPYDGIGLPKLKDEQPIKTSNCGQVLQT